MTKEQLIKEFREKFNKECAGRYLSGWTDNQMAEWWSDKCLSAFDAGRASGIEEAVRRCAGVITCTQDIDGAVCDCCQRNFEVIDSLTPFSSKDN